MMKFVAVLLVARLSTGVFGGLDDPTPCSKQLGECQNNGDAACHNRCTNAGYISGSCNSDSKCECTAECEESYVMGEPYYQLWDGSTFWTHSLVRHTLVRPKTTSELVPDFVLSNTNECEYGDCDEITYSWFGSYPRTIELEVYDKHINITINNREERFVTVNKIRVGLPYQFRSTGSRKGWVSIERSGYNYYGCGECGGLTVRTDFGLGIVVTAGVRNVQVYLPKTPEFMGNIEGALGDFDGIPNNDMQYPSGRVFHAGSSEDVALGDDFIWEWRNDETRQTKGKPRPVKQKTCSPNIKRRAEEKCVTDFNAAFADCFVGPYKPWWVDYYMQSSNQWLRQWYTTWWQKYGSTPYYQDLYKQNMLNNARFAQGACQNDVCLIEKPNAVIDNGACDSFEMFDSNCRSLKPDANIKEWRSKTFCPIECKTANSHFEKCADCQNTCATNPGQMKKDCGGSCKMSGCVCDNGFVLDEKTGGCVRFGQCRK